MRRFVVAIFPDAASAQEGVRALKDLASEGVIHLHGAATVTMADSGKLTMQVVADDGLALTATGALISGLGGLALGPLATAIFTAGGAVFGASVGLSNRGAGMAFAEQVAQDLAPRMEAVVAEVSIENIAVLATRLEAVGGTVTRRETVIEK